jgi:hypothetical protein
MFFMKIQIEKVQRTMRLLDFHPSSVPMADSCPFQIGLQKLKLLSEICCSDYEILQDDAYIVLEIYCRKITAKLVSIN